MTLPVEASGWHAIYVGLWSNWTDSILKVKLSDDSAYVMMRREEETETSEDPVYSGPSELVGSTTTPSTNGSGSSRT